jgi:hypothetical protein
MMVRKSTTFKGQPKPYGKSGHFDEPRRHSLQAKGIKTGNLAKYSVLWKEQRKDVDSKRPEWKSFLSKKDAEEFAKLVKNDPLASNVKVVKGNAGNEPFSLNRKYWTFERDDNGKLKLSLGNFSDAGWYWSGDKEELAGFLIRLESSQVRDEFLKTMKEEGIKFKDFKKELKKSIQSGDGIYMLTGDNTKWHFGEDGEELYNTAEMEAEEKELKGADKEAFDDAVYDQEYNGTDFDVFKKTTHYRNVRNTLLDAYNKSDTWSQFFDNIKEAKDVGIEESFEFSSNEASESVMRGWKDFMQKDPKFQEKEKMRQAQTNPKQKRIGDY